MIEARRFEVTGTVQGVGFRPFVWRLAEEHHVRGWVRNRSGVVEIHAEGETAELDAFAAQIGVGAPRLARVDAVAWHRDERLDPAGFAVEASVAQPAGDRCVSPDIATCDACLRELLDPKDRRHLYPFINCTDCGPRFTIIEALPYDRSRTSMRHFPMCAPCRAEYQDPRDRRFHAEPIACADCGPRLDLRWPDGQPVHGELDEITVTAHLLRTGAIVAIKGLGGFHLACDATDAEAVRRLRERKARPDKPFAVMVADLASARTWFRPTEPEAAELASPRAPIVLVADGGFLPSEVAPGHRCQGVMLPSTPLHHLLTRSFGRPLVMTSGNRADEPICTDNDEALARLGTIADGFLLHDREIVARYDDSVVRVVAERLRVLRRGRSLAPAPLRLPRPVPAQILAVGGELHGAFCLASGERAFLSQHVGDLDTEDAMGAFEEAIRHSRTLFGIEPQAVAHDLHPDLLSTRFAERLGLPRVPVQHHHAHIVATMAEHGLDGEVLGLAFDGFGLGDDATAWGGEVLVCTWEEAARVGRLRRVRQPGGDGATRNPVRMALSHALDSGVFRDAVALLDLAGGEADAVLAQVRVGAASPLTSSAGRLFDAVAALTGACARSSYDGQAPAALEQLAAPEATLATAREEPSVFVAGDGILELDTRPLIGDVVHDLTYGAEPATVAARFHAGLAAATAALVERACSVHDLDRVVLGGGVFANRILTESLSQRLDGAGLRVYLPEQVPVGDGGLALGQVLVAAARLERGT